MSNKPFIDRKDIGLLWTSMMKKVFPDEDLQEELTEKISENCPANFLKSNSKLFLLKSEISSLKSEVSALKFENQQLKQKILNSQTREELQRHLEIQRSFAKSTIQQKL
jgi:RNA recognition motif-containing protein